MRHDLLSDSMVLMQNAEAVGKAKCSVIRSNLMKSILLVMEKYGYVDKIKVNPRMIDVRLVGNINRSRSIKPRYAVKYDEFERFEKRYLPSKNVGIIIISTSHGVMSHREAKEKKIGGRLLAFVY